MAKTHEAIVKLSDAQLVILSAAAQRPDGSLLPFPQSRDPNLSAAASPLAPGTVVEIITGRPGPCKLHPGDILKLGVKAQLQRVGREMRLVVHNADDRAEANRGLLRIVARAHDFQERLIEDPDLTVPAIASQERLTIGYLSRLLRLPSLAPDIVTAIINGKHPPELSAKRLMRLSLKLPTDWVAQRKLLGFQGE